MRIMKALKGVLPALSEDAAMKEQDRVLQNELKRLAALGDHLLCDIGQEPAKVRRLIEEECRESRDG
ncbi:hypothetical protein AB4072_12525 [Microvirga sp. 2MCAF38]|uniref:hypothetical protein n=1 Tax=Microvirga sp. 2MCAF38 TaxID=3232989 RepID=UPI003F980D2A